MSAEPTPFDSLGGEAAIDRLVERFYAEMDARPEAQGIRAMHAGNLEPVKFVLKRYLGEWLGGPPLYSRDRGHPRLRMRHMRFPIGEAERDAWLGSQGFRVLRFWNHDLLNRSDSVLATIVSACGLPF